MGKVIAEITMSVDGFIAGRDISNKTPMGTNGQRLHEWLFSKATKKDTSMIAQTISNTGAVITGNRTYATAIEEAWAGASPFDAPAFVICHTQPAKKVKGFVYITGGIRQALDLARANAGEKNVWVMGGANVIQQYIQAALIEELHLHIAPVLLMQGTKLFENTGTEPIELLQDTFTKTPGALHMTYRVIK